MGEGAAQSDSRAGKRIGLLTLGDIDGRTVAARNAKALITALENDLGGADRLSAGEREIVQRAALSSAVLQDMEAHWIAGRPLDVTAYTTLANTQSRLLKLLGLARRPRDVTPDLARYIEAHATAAPPSPAVPTNSTAVPPGPLPPPPA